MKNVINEEFDWPVLLPPSQVVVEGGDPPLGEGEASSTPLSPS